MVFWNSTRAKLKPRAFPRAALRLERLEARDCPSAPQIMLMEQTMSGHMVQLSGSVMDSNSASVNITFNGAVSGSVQANSGGTFNYLTNTASLGTVYAVGVDGQGLQSNTATATVSDQAPSITLNVMTGMQKTVMIMGRVTDIDAGGRTVTLSGVVQATVVTNSDGTFNLTAQASGLGNVYANTVDLWGLASNTAQATVTSSPPTISNFTAIQTSNNVYTFTGHVSDESPQGLIIHFGGLPDLQGQTATVQADGSFTFTIALKPGESGTATAQTTDWWGLQSNQAWDMV